MKKIISMLTAVLMLVTLFAVPANATSYARVELNAAEYHVGDTVIATVYLDLDEKVTSFGVDYPFDEDVLTFVEDESSWNEDANSIMETIVDLKGNYKAAWTASKGTNFSTLSGGALTLVFTVNKLAPGGETTINFNVVLKNNGVNEVVPVTIKTACANHTYGDWAKEDDDNHKRVCTTENCTGFETAPHNWDSGVVTTDPTCCDKGVKTFTCADCKATKTEDVDPTGEHVYGDWADNGDGNHIRSCTGTNCSETETEAHIWNEGEVTTDPTCCDKGVKTYTCTKCDATKTEDVDPTGEHVYGDWVDNGDGTHTKTCTGTTCTDAVTADHVWDAGVVTTEPTCCDKGVKTYTCTDCGATKTEDVDPTGEHVYGDWVDNGDGTHTKTCTGSTCRDFVTADHVWDAGVVTTEPSCNEKGVKTFTCECGATYTEDIDPTGEHTYGSWVDNGDGTHTHTCTGTGCTASETKDHVWGEGEVTTDPTCCDKGVRTYTCGCGATYTEDIDPTGEHTYGAWTSADDNNHVRNCTGTNCTESETKAHDWANACDDTCDTCGHTRTITHDYATEWSSNASQHWHECNVCGNKTDIASHDHDSNNVCACGHIKPANQFVSGYIYVNKDYHMIIMTNGVLTSGHVVDANGDCILCLGHIVDDEIVVEVEDPIEPSTDEEEVVEVPEVDETPEVEENPKTGIAFGLVALAASACAVLLSKKR